MKALNSTVCMRRRGTFEVGAELGGVCSLLSGPSVEQQRKPLVGSFEALTKALIHPFKALIDQPEPVINPVKALIDQPEPVINPVEPVINPVELHLEMLGELVEVAFGGDVHPPDRREQFHQRGALLTKHM